MGITSRYLYNTHLVSSHFPMLPSSLHPVAAPVLFGFQQINLFHFVEVWSSAVADSVEVAPPPAHSEYAVENAI